MKRLMVYSHDTFGLGNIRRMLAICEHVTAAIPDVSILLISGSPMIHSFRLPPRLDYIKLPCLRRTARDGYAVKSMGTSLHDTVKLRSELILTTAVNFQPDVLLIDKKPYGVENELHDMLAYVQASLPETRKILLLRDILDSPEATRKVWVKQGYYDIIRALYDLVLVVGTPEVFDLRSEYRFPVDVAEKVRFCGYIRRAAGATSRDTLRTSLALRGDKLILVTPGGGEDGYHLLSTYVASLACLPARYRADSLIMCGPEMPAAQRQALAAAVAPYPQVHLGEFTNDMLSYMAAADVVVSMAGYNTVCELLSLQRPAVVVPRVHPVAEQWIRAERMADLGLLHTLHPDTLTPQRLMQAVVAALDTPLESTDALRTFDLDALPRIASYISTLGDNDEDYAMLGSLDPREARYDDI